MHGRWRVAHQYAGGETFIRVFRIRNTSEIDHLGNREYIDQIFNNDEEAQAFADRLNSGEEGSRDRESVCIWERRLRT